LRDRAILDHHLEAAVATMTQMSRLAGDRGTQAAGTQPIVPAPRSSNCERDDAWSIAPTLMLPTS